MQLKHVNHKAASSFVRQLLKAAKKLKLTNHYTLARAIGVDEDSTQAVLRGARPNTRTVDRYVSFVKEVVGEAPTTDFEIRNLATREAPPAPRKTKVMAKGKSKAKKKPTVPKDANPPSNVPAKSNSKLTGKPPGGRRPAVLPRVVPGSGLGIHQQLAGLSQVLTELANRLQSAHEQALEASQHVSVLMGVTKTLDQDPVLKELLNGDPATRAALGQLIKALHPVATPALVPNAKTRTKNGTLTQKVR